MGMRHPRIDEDRVALTGIERRPIFCVRTNVWLGGEVLIRPARQDWIGLASQQTAIGSSYFG